MNTAPTASLDAWNIASAIYAGSDIEDKEDRLYAAVDVAGLSDDEVKADLYSRIAEHVGTAPTFVSTLCMVDAALSQTRKVFPRG